MVLLAGNIREGKMQQFVGHHPIVIELVLRGELTDRDTSKSTLIAVRCTVKNAAPAFRGTYHDPGMGHRKPAIVSRDGIRGARDPGQYLGLGQVNFARSEVHLNRATA